MKLKNCLLNWRHVNKTVSSQHSRTQDEPDVHILKSLTVTRLTTCSQPEPTLTHTDRYVLPDVHANPAHPLPVCVCVCVCSCVCVCVFVCSCVCFCLPARINGYQCAGLLWKRRTALQSFTV